MNKLFDIDWHQLFVPSVPIVETILRGTVVYLALFALLRFLLRREAGTVGVTDLLVVVLIADAAQNAMASDYKSITDGILLVVIIVFWDYMLDWLGQRFPRFQRFLSPPPLTLIKDGRMNRRNMRRELSAESELMSQLRQQGVDDAAKVKAAYIEGDGHISVITHGAETHSSPKDKEAAT